MQTLCRSKFFGLAASIASKPMFWQAVDKASLPPARDSEPNTEGDERGALEVLWGLHETWQGLEKREDLELAEGVEIGDDEREACSVALKVVGRIRESSKSRWEVEDNASACDVSAEGGKENNEPLSISFRASAVVAVEKGQRVGLLIASWWI